MRRRLVLAIAGVAAAAVALFAVPLALELERSHRDEALLRLQRDTVAATREIDLGTGRGDPIELPRSAARLAVYDAAGMRVAGGGPARAPALVRRALRARRPAVATGDGRLAVAVPLLSGERVTGAVRAVRSDDDAARGTRGGLLLLAAVGAGVVALAVGAALLLGRRLAGPLERLAGAARRLGEGDFSTRAPRAGVSEVDAVARALDATASRLDELVTRERSFSADASHQLRTPLAALRLELEALQLRGDGALELTGALEQVERLQATIDTLLAVARDSPRGSDTAGLAAAVDRAEERWRGTLAAEGRPLRTLVAAGDPSARAAPRVVDEILDVLLDNAHRHGAGEVTLRVREAGEWLALEVADEGTGFEGERDQAFARRGAGRDGHGIGLDLARSLAHAEGGRLEIARLRPQPVVRLVLPGAASHEPAAGSGDSKPQESQRSRASPQL